MRKLFLPVLLLVGVVGCKKDQEAKSVAHSRAVPAPLAEPAAGPRAADDDISKLDPSDQRKVSARKLVLTGAVTIEVTDVAEARRKVDALTRELGGHLGRLDTDATHGGASAQLTIRVPAERYDEAVARLGNIGTVVRESANAEDITEAYTDLASRLANQKAMEARLLSLLERKENTLAELLGLEQELGRVREQIELLEGRIRLYDDQVALSTISVQLQGPGVVAAVTQGGEPTVAGTLAGSASALRAFGKGLLLLLVALLPWSPLLVAGGWGIRRIVRWHRVSTR